jgi:transcriptional antiterminator RfaH
MKRMWPSAIHARWYVVQCKPREDARALENLQRQGFECYGPQLLVEKLRHGRRARLAEPLFPGYLFIHLDDVNDNWYPIRSTRGVLKLVRFNNYPLAVKDHLIELIRQRLLTQLPTKPYLVPGDPVRITEGPFAQIEAVFVANDGDERVALLINILSREQTLSFPVTHVHKARVS